MSLCLHEKRKNPRRDYHMTSMLVKPPRVSPATFFLLLVYAFVTKMSIVILKHMFDFEKKFGVPI